MGLRLLRISALIGFCLASLAGAREAKAGDEDYARRVAAALRRELIRTRPAGKGDVFVDFVIGPTGKVIEAEVRGEDPAAVGVVRRVLQRLEAPAPPGGLFHGRQILNY